MNALTAHVAEAAGRQPRTLTGRAVGSCSKCGAGVATDGVKVDTVRQCPHCGVRVRLKLVYGEHSAVPCNSSCMSAIRNSCSCACGGANHGAWFLPIELVPVWDQEKARKAQTKRVADHADRARQKRERVEAARVAARDALIAANPILGALLTDEYAEPTPFMASLKRALQAGAMSTWQVKRACQAITDDRTRAQERADRRRAEQEREEHRAAARAAGVRVPVGRVTAKVRILSVREDVNPFSYRADTVWKITVEHPDGWRAYGTAPRGLEPARQPADGRSPAERDLIAAEWVGWHDRLPGREVTMAFSLRGPKDAADPLFGYFTHPRLADPADASPAPRATRAARTPDSHAAAPAAPAAPVDPWAGLLTAAAL